MRKKEEWGKGNRKNKIKTIFLFDGTKELKEDLLNIAREERIALKKELFA